MKTLKIVLFIILLNTTLISIAQCSSKVKCGAYHTSILKTDGSIWAFGYGDLGSLGNGNDSNSYTPIPLGPGTNWSKIENGTYSTFAIKNDGTLWGTGYNLNGQLGINSTSEHASTLTQIGTVNNWKEIAPSDFFTIALKTNNTIWGWGQNNSNQMGDGTCCANRLLPGQIGAATDWVMIAVSQARSAFAIKNNGTLWCWGLNIAGLLGSNLVGGYAFPTQHNTDTDWASITLGNTHMLALKTNGTLWSWGSGGQGQTGDGLAPTVLRYEPLQIGTSNWKMVAGGSNTSFGIKMDGTLWAWGQNDTGQLGIGGITANQPLPVQIGTDNNWDKVDAGYQNAMAVKTDGSLWAWGDNIAGQFGNGTTTGSTSPILIPVTGCVLSNEDFYTDNKFIISPNPSKESTNISFEYSTAPTIEVYSLLGVKIDTYTAKEANGSWEFNTASLPAGVYIIVMKDKEKILLQKKLIVE